MKLLPIARRGERGEPLLQRFELGYGHGLDLGYFAGEVSHGAARPL